MDRNTENNKLSFDHPSADGIHTLKGNIYTPLGEMKGYIQIVHGMTEHIERYDRFMRALAESGYFVFGFDNLGHGYTANNDSELGYIAKENGWDILARDVANVAKHIISEWKKEYGKCPYTLLGHSMGSFIVRVAADKYITPDKLIIMGTSGNNPAADAGLALISVIKKIKGEKHYSPLIDNIAFGSYNKRFGGGTKDDPSPWLTNDKDVRAAYYANKFCTFKFTVSAMGDLIRLIKECNTKKWYGSVAKKCPILLVSGCDDPVGNYGKGVLEVRDGLKERGADVECILYKGARHEILNDFTYNDVINDIIKFVEK